MNGSSNLGFFIQNAWVVPALPFFSFLIVGLFLRPLSARISAVFGTLSIFTAALWTYGIAWNYFGSGEGAAIVPWSFEWLRFQPGMTVQAGVLLDPISVMLLTVVTTVSTLVHLYASSYMEGDEGYGRFFTYLSLFTFSMLGLVVAPNIFQIYVFWELVGVSSFLLIGFYYQKPSAVAASKKAFIVTRFADLGFFTGILLLGYSAYTISQGGGLPFGADTQALDFAFLTHSAVVEKLGQLPTILPGVSVLTLSLILIYMGAAGKSAMFPLHVWLPDAMEGPTPVSALIHAATMVVAGVYLVARLFPAFAHSGGALEVVAYVGLFTSAFAAVIACTQDDLKRVLAFSTLSQLGYMMFALGVATFENPLGYTAAMFHLFTHAFFKALLFLGAGAVIHAVHTNNVWEMGGLRKHMPVTHGTFAIAVLAIAGIWPFAGFFSKDEILGAALGGGRLMFFVVGLAVAGLTSFYMCRIYFLTFWGKGRSDHAHHAHEAPFRMLLPLLVLAFLSTVTGFIPFGEFVKLGHEAEHGGINFAVAIPATLVALTGISLAAWMYAGELGRSERVATLLGGIYRVIKKKFYIDEVYLFVTHRIIFRLIAAPVAWFDRAVVDGSMNGVGWSTRKLSDGLTLLQTGQVQTYGFWFVLGAIFVLGLYGLTVN